jgi:hypothetical protein
MNKIKLIGLKFTILFPIIFFFLGCGQQPFPGNTIEEASIFHDDTKKSGIEILNIPNINSIRTIEVGEDLYQKINQITSNTFNVILLENTMAKLFNGGSIITNKDNNFKDNLLYKWENKNAMCFDSTYDYFYNRPIKICLIDDNNNGYFSHAVYSYKNIKYPLVNIAKYEIIPTKSEYNQDSFKYIALYQGKRGNSIKISFREFKDDMARPSFTQDIDYELNKDGSTIIGFKGLRIEVIKATNIDITYKVVKDYN